MMCSAPIERTMSAFSGDETMQTGVAPPTFTLVASRAEALHFSETRRVENLVREMGDFTGSPIRISVRGRSREEK